MGKIFLNIEADNRMGYYDHVTYGGKPIMGYLNKEQDPAKLLAGPYVSVPLSSQHEPLELIVQTHREWVDFNAPAPVPLKARLVYLFVLQKTEAYDHPNTTATKLAGRPPSDPIYGPAVAVFES